MFILVALIPGYYIAMQKVVGAQLSNLESFYSNIDQYAVAVSENKDVTVPDSLYKLSQPKITESFKN